MKKINILFISVFISTILIVFSLVFIWALSNVDETKQDVVNNIGSRVDTFLDYYTHPNYQRISANYIVYSYKSLYCNPEENLSTGQRAYLYSKVLSLKAASKDYPVLKILNNVPKSASSKNNLGSLCSQPDHNFYQTK